MNILIKVLTAIFYILLGILVGHILFSLFPVRAETITVSYTFTTTSSTNSTPKDLKKTIDSSATASVSLWKQIVRSALKQAKKHDYPPSVLLGMIALESGHGTSEFATERYNFCGLNAVDSNPDLAYSYTTVEEGVEACIQLIKDNPHYAKAYAARKNPLKMLKEIKAANYATDPAYVAK